MADKRNVEELAAQAAEAVRRALSDAEARGAEIIRDAEATAASIREKAEAEATKVRERAEADARAQIEAAKRALDELGGSLAAAVSSATPKAEAESQKTESDPEQPEKPEEPAAGNSDDAAERLVAMKMAVDGKDQAAIEAELVEKFGPGDRTELLKDVLARVPR
jgi:hypothetical protein